MTQNFISITHASLIVQDITTAINFYCEILGLELDTSRPDLGYPGAWLRVGNQQIHLLELPNPDPVDGRPEHGGRDRHIAFNLISLDSMESSLIQNGISFTRSRSGRRALFVRDPDGNALELIEQN